MKTEPEGPSVWRRLAELLALHRQPFAVTAGPHLALPIRVDLNKAPEAANDDPPGPAQA